MNYPTRNSLDEITRDAMAQLLNAHLASAIDLGLQCKYAHWNVRGPQFYALHLLFDTLAEGIEEHIDDIAERAVSLGVPAAGSLQTVFERTALDAYPTGDAMGAAHLEALVKAFSTFGRGVRAAIDQATEAGDADTADLFTGVSRALDKGLWMLEAHRVEQNA